MARYHISSDMSSKLMQAALFFAWLARFWPIHNVNLSSWQSHLPLVTLSMPTYLPLSVLFFHHVTHS